MVMNTELAQITKRHHCDCMSGVRTLVLLASRLDEEYPEVFQIAKEAGWKYHSQLEALEIEIGGSEAYKSLAEVSNFLRNILDENRFNSLRATWTSSGVPLMDQLRKLIHAGPLTMLAQLNSSELLDILQSKRIESWYQPIFDLRSERLWGYECLLRARDVEGQLIYPNQLLAWARQENLIFMLDRMCRETHLLNAGSTIPNIEQLHIFVNFLPSSIYRPEYCLRTTSIAAQKAGLRPEQVIFEVVETEAITDMNHLRMIIEEYRKMGYKIALDDVGSGFSSLQVLADLGPDLIKIDRQLIRTYHDSDFHRNIIQALVDMARKSGKLVLAEGVETEMEHHAMLSLGVDLVQGYYYGRPSPNPISTMKK